MDPVRQSLVREPEVSKGPPPCRVQLLYVRQVHLAKTFAGQASVGERHRWAVSSTICTTAGALVSRPPYSSCVSVHMTRFASSGACLGRALGLLWTPLPAAAPKPWSAVRAVFVRHQQDVLDAQKTWGQHERRYSPSCPGARSSSRRVHEGKAWIKDIVTCPLALPPLKCAPWPNLRSNGLAHSPSAPHSYPGKQRCSHSRLEQRSSFSAVLCWTGAPSSSSHARDSPPAKNSPYSFLSGSRTPSIQLHDLVVRCDNVLHGGGGDCPSIHNE